MSEFMNNALMQINQIPQPMLMLHIVAALVSLIAIRYIVIPTFISQLLKRHSKWEKIFTKHKPLTQLQYLIPLLFIDDGLSGFQMYTSMLKYIEITLVASCMVMAVSVLKTAGGIYRFYPIAKQYPISNYIELGTLVIYIVSGLIIFSLLLDKSPVYLLSGLGALTAVLMLIFQNTIKSFIAGVQIGVNNLIQEEDWIEIPSLGVSGLVQEVALHFVEVRNFDNTTMIVPTYQVIDGSFKNWRSVFELGARRIVTAINIDHESIKTLNQNQLEYILQHNELSILSKATFNLDATNSNLALFRVYAETYIKNHPDLSSDSTTMTRLLDSTPQGIPLQIYCFSSVTSWVDYEKIKSQIIEHLLSVMPLFELSVLQLKYQQEAIQN